MNLEPNNKSLSFAEFLDAAIRDKAEAKPFPYTLEVCRCRYCSFCQNGKCALKRCCCMNERVKARSCTFAELLRDCFANFKDNVFQFRLRIACERATELHTCFLDAGHRARFYEGVSYMRKKDSKFIAQLYLLSASELLWIRAKQVMCSPGFIDYSCLDLKLTEPNAYLYFCTAMDIQYGGSHIDLYELTLDEIVDFDAFRVICNSVAICLYGMDAVKVAEKRKKHKKKKKLVSICVVILLAFPLVIGAQAASLYEFDNSVQLTLASARSTPCTTPAGAFDAYGKSILDRNGYYRAMCAPESMQADLLKEMLENDKAGIYPIWEPGLDEWANTQSGYYIYNLQHLDNNTYEGLFVVELNYPPDGKPQEVNMMYLAVQNLRVEKENGRWVVIPLEELRYVETLKQSLAWGCTGLPGIVYAGESHDFRVEITFQTIHTIDSTVTNQNDLWFMSNSYYDTTPKPNADFTNANRSHNTVFTYIGLDANKDSITHIGVSAAPMYEGEKRPTDMIEPVGNNSSGGSHTGYQWASKELHPGWNSVIPMNGGGGSDDPQKKIKYPSRYAADLYINNQKVAELDLLMQKGEAE